MFEQKKTTLILLVLCMSMLYVNVEGKLADEYGNEQVIWKDIEEDTPYNISTQLVTNLTSYREDGLPSTKSEEYFSVRFNVTNNDAEPRYNLKLQPNVNGNGELNHNNTITKEVLNPGTSWLTAEYVVKSLSEGSQTGGALDLTIVLDQSGSMGDEIDIITENLISVVNELSDTVSDLRIGLILFGGDKHNPILYEELITPMTENIPEIVEVLANTQASGGEEPWGDALYVAKNQMNWRDEAANLVILITDESGDDGEVILLSEIETLYQQYSNENIILCTIAATGSDTLTKSRLKTGAEMTEGTYIEIGSENYPQTDDLPQIIGELIVKYAVELDLRISVDISYTITPEPQNEEEEKNTEEEFIIIIDDMAPEILTTTYITEDFLTDTKYLNIKIEARDLSRIKIIELYYQLDEQGLWVLGVLNQTSNTSYVTLLECTPDQETVTYYIYASDNLGNTMVTEEKSVDLTDELDLMEIGVNKRGEIELQAYQALSMKFTGDTVSDSYILIESYYGVNFSLFALDIGNSTPLVDIVDVTQMVLNLERGHEIKIHVWSFDSVRIQAFNLIPKEIDFQTPVIEELTEDNAFLLTLDNRRNEEDDRSLMVDSPDVYAKIRVYNISNWELITSGETEVILPEEECFVVVYSYYHFGEVNISFDLETNNEPHYHFPDGAMATISPFMAVLLSILVLALSDAFRKRKRC